MPSTYTSLFGGVEYDVLYIDANRPSPPVDPPSSVVLPAGHVKEPGSRPFSQPTLFEHNQAFALRDGVKLRADIYRPVTNTPVPAIVVWGPYGKSGTGAFSLKLMPLRAGVPMSKLSGYESFEGPDPAEWVPRDYAVVNVDCRGSGDSEGNLYWWGTGDGQDGYDFIEAIAEQPWCSGRVALAGNSWLAMCQWFIASQRPPHLAAIAPLEGSGDVLRETSARGGIPNPSFPSMVQQTVPIRQQQEDVVGMLDKYPNGNSYWNDKRADFNQIEVPAYIGGSYSTNLHTLGAFRAFEEIPHEKKWLVVHSSQEWYDLYSAERTEDLAKFFDFYLKDIRNGWEDTVPVRLSALGYNVANQVYSYPSLPWTWDGAKQLRLYLNADQTLSPTSQESDSAVLSYQADVPGMNRGDDDGELLFKYTFPDRTVIAGPSKVTINLSAEMQDDLDVYVMLRKADANGEILESVNQPLSDLGVASADEVPRVSVLKYLGPEGMLRASKREVAPEFSKPWWPTLSHATNEPVPQGQTIQLEIALWPTGMIFEAGETLILKVSGHDMRLVDLTALQGSFQVANQGKHYVHFENGILNYLDLYLL